MSKRKNPTARKDPNVYPPGWNYQKAMKIAEYYDNKKDTVILDDDAEQTEAGLIWMEVPQELVPEIRKLIARRRKTA
jgi:hypothetical protein